MGFWPLIYAVIKKSDILVLVVDARNPELTRNAEVERIVSRFGKQLVIVFNKKDLVNAKALGELRKIHKDAYFVSASKNIGIARLKTGLLIMGKRMGKEYPEIGILGYPNVGKSALINVLAKGARTQVSSRAGTTRGIQRVRAGGLKILDSPGVIPYWDKEEKLGLIGAKSPERMKNPEKVAYAIIRNVVEKNKDALEKFYDIKIEEEDDYEILLKIGKRRGFLLKKGKIDENRTAFQIIRDWQIGKMGV